MPALITGYLVAMRPTIYGAATRADNKKQMEKP